jgi:hypothetical protein
MTDKPVTDFPIDDDTRRVSLRTSNYRAFDLRFALDLRKNFPALWNLGEPLVEEDRFETLIPIQRRGGSVRNTEEERTVRRREQWAMHHAKHDDLGGVIAQIRWLVVGRMGIDRMKLLVNDAKQDAMAVPEHAD